MANCDNCIKVSPIPECSDTESFTLTGFTFPNHTDSTLTARIKNMATGRIDYVEFTTDPTGIPDLDIGTLFPLPVHPYEISFMASNGTPAEFLLTNPDDTSATGCCMELGIYKGLTASTTWQLITQDCTA